MRAFTTVELARLQATQVSSMQDVCILESRSAGTSAYGYSHGYADGVTTVCGLHMSPSREVMEAGQVALPDARLRLPIATVVANVDRVRVTHRYGAALAAPLTYEVIGLPERGPSGLQLNLRLATTGETSTPIAVGVSLDFSDSANSMYLGMF